MLISKQRLFFLSTKFAAFCAVSVIVSGSVFSAHASDADSTFGLPARATQTSYSSSEESSGVSTMMGLPDSTQGQADRVGAYLYLSYNSARMNNSSITNTDYTSDFGTANFGFPSVDFFNRITYLGRDFSLWGRYSLGVADRSGTLSDAVDTIDSSIEKSSLFLFAARVGALLSYDRLNWIKPYAGVELDPYIYRVDADIEGGDLQGGNLNYGPVLGVHAPVLFHGTASILAEYKYTVASHGGGQIFASSSNFTAGMGLTF